MVTARLNLSLLRMEAGRIRGTNVVRRISCAVSCNVLELIFPTQI